MVSSKNSDIMASIPTKKIIIIPNPKNFREISFKKIFGEKIDFHEKIHTY